MSGQINDLVPLIRKHFDFLVSEWGFECVRTWSDFMSRYQGAEYRSGPVVVLVEQADSPILDVRLTDGHSDHRASLNLDEIVREADPEAWSRRPQGCAWPRPIEQDDEQLWFLAECMRRYCGAWLRVDSGQRAHAERVS